MRKRTGASARTNIGGRERPWSFVLGTRSVRGPAWPESVLRAPRTEDLGRTKDEGPRTEDCGVNLQNSGEEKIPASAETVWAFVTDPEKVGYCFPDVVDVT